MKNTPAFLKQDNRKMRITPFSPGWWLYLGLAFGILSWLGMIFSDSSREHRLHFIFVFSICELTYLLIYKWSLRFFRENYSPWNELPCYLCNLSTLISIIASGLDLHYLQCFCLTVGVLGTMLAFLMPDGPNADLPLFSLNALGFYGYHAMLLVSCLSYHALEICTVRFSDIPVIMLITLISLIAAHCTNSWLRRSILPTANYIFTYDPDNFVLKAAFRLLPLRFFYLLPLFVPGALLAAVLIILYGLI